MRPFVLICEFVTSGGLVSPSEALLREGDVMVRALVADLLDDGRYAVRVLRQGALPALPDSVRTIRTETSSTVETALRSHAKQAAVVWLIAPETEGALWRLTRLLENAGATLAGANSASIAIAGSKLETSRCLARAGVACVATEMLEGFQAQRPNEKRWVVKPDDGAGCEATYVACSLTRARQLAANIPIPHAVIQPWIDGDALSLSCVALHDRCEVISVNRQHVEVDGELVRFKGVTAGIEGAAIGNPLALTTAIRNAIPGLYGYFGVDLVSTDDVTHVVEVNPRLTTSYAGIRAALGLNVAALILDDLQRRSTGRASAIAHHSMVPNVA